MVGISRYIDKGLIERITALSVGESRGGQALARAISGNGESSENKIARTVRFGAQTYARSLAGINFAGSLINLAQSDLAQLSDLTKKAITIAEEAAKETASKQDRRLASTQLVQIGKEFNEIIDGAEVGEKKYLTKISLEEVFVSIGLDPEQSKSAREAFDSFQLLDTEGQLADLDIKGDQTNLPLTAGQPSATQFTAEIFSAKRNIHNQADAQAILDDLKALDKQIDTNYEAVDKLRVTLLDNAVLARSAALALGDIASEISSEDDAKDIADRLQLALRKDARGALAQAENLEPLIVAALTFDENNLLS